MVQWDGMDSKDTGVVSGTTRYIPFSPNVQWDGMDSRDTGVVSGTTRYIPNNTIQSQWYSGMGWTVGIQVW